MAGLYSALITSISRQRTGEPPASNQPISSLTMSNFNKWCARNLLFPTEQKISLLDLAIVFEQSSFSGARRQNDQASLFLADRRHQLHDPGVQKARPMKKEWATSIRDQCLKRGVAFFFKQWGGRNKKAPGRLLEGQIWNQLHIPEEVWSIFLNKTKTTKSKASAKITAPNANPVLFPFDIHPNHYLRLLINENIYCIT